MFEKDKAKEIQKVLAQARYDASNRNGAYSVLIDKAGACSEFASAAISMAKAMGLKCATYGGNGHQYYYIWVDGVRYGGENKYLNLATPTPSHIDSWITPMN